MEQRCTGHCCDTFTLQFSPNELQSIVESYKVLDDHKPDVNAAPPELIWTRDSGEPVVHNFSRKEVEYIADMVIHKGVSVTEPSNGKDILTNEARRGKHLMDKRNWTKERLQNTIAHGMSWVNGDKNLAKNIYTCRHFDGNSGNCMSYESRPNMCSVYPNGRVCTYTKCTSSCSKEPIVLVAHKPFDYDQMTKELKVTTHDLQMLRLSNTPKGRDIIDRDMVVGAKEFKERARL